MRDSNVPLRLSGDFEIVLGGNSECDVVLPDLQARHAKLMRIGDRLFLKDLGSENGTYVNRRRLRSGRWQEVTRFDELLLGDRIVNLSPKFFLGRDRLGLDTTRLRYLLRRSRRVLCDGAYLRARPGRVTAILGPAGCGKTVFLSLLNGSLVPTEGKVRIGKSFDPAQDRRLLRDFVGYVPQDDTLIPDLTVRQSLHYRLRLKFPDMSESIRHRLIRETCGRLGFHASRVDVFLDSRIGSADSRRRGLSGGERKRANIAHELITKPLVLILDEPTSGLSSVDADQIVRLLTMLAKDELVSVIATIHQPSRLAFDCFDDLMVMSWGGKLAYYGEAARAVGHFEQATHSPCRSENPSEYLLNRLIDPVEGYQLEMAFERAAPVLGSPAPLTSDEAMRADLSLEAKEASYTWLFLLFSQLNLLTRRNLRAAWADHWSLALSVLQAPIVALLVVCAFHDLAADTEQVDRFARVIYFFDMAKEPFETEGRTIPIDKLLEESTERAESATHLIGPVAAQRRGAVHFALVAAALWFGTLGACREVVSEQRILRREVRTCVNLLPYLTSKMLVQVILRGPQTGLLAVIVSFALLDYGWWASIQLWAILWLTAVASASLGLLISSAAPSGRAALTAVPLLMIPQLLFGGVLRPQPVHQEDMFWPHLAGALTIQRWGFQAALAVESSQEAGALKQEVGTNWDDRYWELNLVRFEKADLLSTFFSDGPWGRGLPPIPVLGLSVPVLLAAGYVTLRIRFS